MADKKTEGVQVQGKPKLKKSAPCPWLCNLVPTNVPAPGPAQTVLHPRKDVFVLKGIRKNEMAVYDADNCNPRIGPRWPNEQEDPYVHVAKVGAMGDRRCKMELELVTPKAPERKPPGRVDTRETQCDPEPCPCCCQKAKKTKKK